MPEHAAAIPETPPQEDISATAQKPVYIKESQPQLKIDPALPRVLIIMHGPLRFFLQSLGAMAAIRNHHRQNEIILLTTKPFKNLSLICPYVNKVWVDPLPRWFDVDEGWAMYKQFQHLNVGYVYDLMCNERTNWYFRLSGRKKPQWSGAIPWCSFPYMDPNRYGMHLSEQLEEQLRAANIARVPKPEIDWIAGDIGKLALPARYALLVAGGSNRNPQARWHVYGFVELCDWLAEQGITPVLLGAAYDEETVNAIISGCDKAKPVSLVNQTHLRDIPALAKGAVMAVGNDSGPLHLIAMSGCPTLLLASQYARPEIEAPQVSNLYILEELDLNHLAAREVITAINEFIAAAPLRDAESTQ